jgi:hypothetical protein
MRLPSWQPACVKAFGAGPVGIAGAARPCGLATAVARRTRNAKRLIERAMTEPGWVTAGQGWQGKEASLRLVGWSRQRWVILRRRPIEPTVAVIDGDGSGRSTCIAARSPPIRRPRSLRTRCWSPGSVAKISVGKDLRGRAGDRRG